jgi:uncharacterized protein
MKQETVAKLIYLGGICLLGAVLIPGNLPFLFYLKKLAAAGETAVLLSFNSSRNISVLPLSLAERFFYTFFPFILLLIVLLVIWRTLHRKGTDRLLSGPGGFRWSLMGRGLISWAVLSALADLVQFLLHRENYRFTPEGAEWFGLILLGLVFIVPQVAFEEIFFRGYLIKGGTLLTGKPVYPLVFFSLLFGLLHSSNPEVSRYGYFLMMPQYIGMGLFLSFLCWKTGGLEMALGIHLANNGWGLLVVNSGGTAFETPALFHLNDWDPLFSLTALGVGMALFLIINRSPVFSQKGEEESYYYDY